MKIKELPNKQKKVKELDQTAITALGFELAASLYENEKKKGLQNENRRLKAVISSMYLPFDVGKKKKELAKTEKQFRQIFPSRSINQNSIVVRRGTCRKGNDSGPLRFQVVQ